MSKKRENVIEPKKPEIPAPSLEEVEKWCDHDLNSAIYFLSMIKNEPDLRKKIAKELYDWSKKNPKLPEDANS